MKVDTNEENLPANELDSGLSIGRHEGIAIIVPKVPFSFFRKTSAGVFNERP